MQPIKYSETEGVVRFHYKFPELREWFVLGCTSGDVGAILWGTEGKFNIYKTFGTIEHPSTTMYTIKMVYSPVFDGPRKTPQEIIDFVPKPFFTAENTHWVVLDTTEDNATN